MCQGGGQRSTFEKAGSWILSHLKWLCVHIACGRGLDTMMGSPRSGTTHTRLKSGVYGLTSGCSLTILSISLQSKTLFSYIPHEMYTGSFARTIQGRCVIHGVPPGRGLRKAPVRVPMRNSDMDDWCNSTIHLCGTLDCSRICFQSGTRAIIIEHRAASTIKAV